MNDLRILVTGVGAFVAPSIIKNYKIVTERNIYVVGVDIKPNVNNKYVDKYYTYKKPTDKDYLEVLLDICKREKIQFIIPLVDDELIVLAENKKLFAENNIIVCVNDPDKIKLVQNKYDLYEYLESNNIEVPKSYLFHTLEEFLEDCKLLDYPKKPIAYKPVISSGARGFRIIADNIDYANYLFKEKADSKYIDIDFFLSSIQKCQNIPMMMLMEYVEGDLYNVNVLAKEGETLYAVAGKVLDFAMGNTIKCQIETNDEVINFCKRITNLLKLNGNVGFEVAYTKEGILKLIEINIRVQGQIFSSTLAGINFPYLELKLYLKEELPSNPSIKEICMIRYFEDALLE